MHDKVDGLHHYDSIPGYYDIRARGRLYNFIPGVGVEMVGGGGRWGNAIPKNNYNNFPFQMEGNYTAIDTHFGEKNQLQESRQLGSSSFPLLPQSLHQSLQGLPLFCLATIDKAGHVYVYT
jgi:hypothetical protein